MTPEEFLQLKSETLLQRQYDELVGQADAAVQELREMKEQIEDPAIKAMIEEIEDHWEVLRPKNKVAPGYAVAALALRDALKKGLHRTPGGREKLYQYMIKTAYEVAKAAAHSIPPYHYIDHNMETLTNPLRMLYDIRTVIGEAAIGKEKDKIAKKYYDAIEDVGTVVSKKIEDATDVDMLDHGKGERILAHKHHNLIENLLEEKIREYEEQGKIPRFWHLSPEEIIGEEKGEGGEKPPEGARILAHPDRYPTLTQKILLKTLILGELQREDERGVDRNLYRALRNLLSTPLTTENWYPLLAEWFENLERGQYTSPLTQLLQKLPVDPRVKQEAYRYLQKIEGGTPINQIPREEREAFKQLMEKVKLEVWRNPRRYLPIIDRLTYTQNLNEREAIKTLVGLIDDLARIYAGEKTPREIGVERDAAQVIHTIKNLEDKGRYIDTYQLAGRLREIIQQHIQDPLLRKAYLTAIQHYTETSHQIPRNNGYLRGVMEKERELEEKLRQLEEAGEKLGELEVKRIAMLYRTLMLLTPHPTLGETKRFYSQLSQNLKVKVGDEAFLPVHGPIAEDLATSFREIRRAGAEEKEKAVRREIASYEPLLYATPHIEKKVEAILSRPHGKTIPLGEHEEFIKHLERVQVRRPIEV